MKFDLICTELEKNGKLTENFPQIVSYEEK